MPGNGPSQVTLASCEFRTTASWHTGSGNALWSAHSGGSDKPTPSHATSDLPVYPPESRRRHEEGATILRIRVSPTGCAAAAAVFISSGSPLLDEAALEWIERASFYPARPEGEAIEALTNIAIDFRIQDNP